MKSSKLDSISDEQFIELVKSNDCYSDIVKAIGLDSNGSYNHTKVKNRVQKLNIDITHFYKNGKSPYLNRKLTLEEVLVVNSTYTRANLRRRIIKLKLIEYKCFICNLDSWNSNKLSLVLDHINGVPNDNRIENLRFLCPNCNSQQSTFAGRNKKKKSTL